MDQETLKEEEVEDGHEETLEAKKEEEEEKL